MAHSTTNKLEVGFKNTQKSVKEKVGYDHWVNISNWLQGSLMKKASIETKDFKKMKVSLS